ncbi:conserved hypothetical protein [Flavobacterium sp. 9AF]|uniref:hypothetical protein n=1 Tax=Flavobacterium sp. 9AF TaxID=2653142 RepID=UPI0012F0D621|nr:hypothetical protein [Flavobacterium sp. 9AF]VXB76577.1 conserved hypothetical protein [Flavobacterium sp. 9AF]
MLDVLLKIRIWITFLRNKGTLPTVSEMITPKMKYEILSGSFIWEDEGLWEHRNHHLQNAFKYVIKHRMNLLVGPDNDVGHMRSKSFDKKIFKMAKKYFPNWIGFQESRCRYNPEIAEKILRIKKVEKWKYEKLLNEE